MKKNRSLTFVATAMVFAVLAFAPAAQACCRPCQGYCEMKGVPADALCCTGIPEPGNACGLTTCGEYLEENGIEPAALALSLLVSPAESCEAELPWLAAAEATPANG